ncbi:MAG: cell division protein ZapA, partial [Catalinimonas sp.]
PMSVAPHEEARVREAARRVNERVSEYRKTFQMDDKQDLLAMVAFMSLVDQQEAQAAREELEAHLARQLRTMDDVLSSVENG